MAALSTSRRSTAGIAFIIAGALILIQVILGLAAVTATGPWLLVLAYLAIAVGFVILAIGSIANIIARIALIAGAIGWLLLALEPIATGIAGIHTVALILAALGGLVGAIVLYTGKEITDRSAVAFIVTTVVAALILLLGLAGVGIDATFALILTIVLGVGFLLTGVLFNRVQRGR